MSPPGAPRNPAGSTGGPVVLQRDAALAGEDDTIAFLNTGLTD